MKEKSKGKSKRRGNRALFDEPTQMITARLPLSMVAALDNILAKGKGLFRDRSDLIREILSEGLKKEPDAILFGKAFRSVGSVTVTLEKPQRTVAEIDTEIDQVLAGGSPPPSKPTTRRHYESMPNEELLLRAVLGDRTQHLAEVANKRLGYDVFKVADKHKAEMVEPVFNVVPEQRGQKPVRKRNLGPPGRD